MKELNNFRPKNGLVPSDRLMCSSFVWNCAHSRLSFFFMGIAVLIRVQVVFFMFLYISIVTDPFSLSIFSGLLTTFTGLVIWGLAVNILDSKLFSASVFLESLLHRVLLLCKSKSTGEVSLLLPVTVVDFPLRKRLSATFSEKCFPGFLLQSRGL